MQAVIDIGNTRIKVGFFEGASLCEVHSCTKEASFLRLMQERRAVPLIFSSVRSKEDAIHLQLEAKGAVALSFDLPGLPLRIDYKTPSSLGADRIASAVGACSLFPDSDCLVVDLGTCVTYTLVQAGGRLLGGAITPGLKLRLQVLATATAQLPQLSLKSSPDLLGRSTDEAIQAGIWHGTRAEIIGLIRAYTTQYKDLRVLLCGGDLHFLDTYKDVPIFVEENLVLVGLQHIFKAYLQEKARQSTSDSEKQ